MSGMAKKVDASSLRMRKPSRTQPLSPSLVKLSPPRLAGVYQRRALFKEIDGLRRHAASWIGAPGGSGKTTLVASYLKARRLRCIWYQVDAGDTDLASFFHYLTLAIVRATGR